MGGIFDLVIATIKASKGKADSKANIMAKFGFTEEQADAIVTLQLYRLSSTDVEELMEENRELEKKINELNSILSDEKKLLSVIKNELKDVEIKNEHQRLTEIQEEIQNIKIDKKELVADEEVMVGVTKYGYIKRSSLRSYSQTPTPGIKENDAIFFEQELSTLDTILIFTNLGNYIFLPIYEIEDQKWKDLGTFISNIVPIEKNERVIKVVPIKKFNKEARVLFATKKGILKQTKLSEFNVTRYSKTLRAMRISPDDEVVAVDVTGFYNEIVVLSLRGRMLRFKEQEITLVGSAAGGIKGINLSNGDIVTSAFYTRGNNDAIILTSRGNIKRVRIQDVPLLRRNKVGTQIIREIKTNPHFIVDAVSMSYAQYKDDVKVSIITEKGSISFTAFNFKYSENDSGKPYIYDSSLGKPLRIFIDDSLNEEIIDEAPIFDAGILNSSSYDEGLFASVEAENNIDDDQKFEKYRNISIFDDDIL